MKPFRGAMLSAAVVLLLGPALAEADTIVIDGKKHENVLVNEGRTTYYVRIPNEGRIITVPASQVDKSQLEINEDPFYREELKARFERVRESGGAVSSDERHFEGPATPGGGEDVDINALLGQGGGGGGPIPGLSRAQFEQLLSQAGIRFQPAGNMNGQPAVKATIPGGSMTLVGPPGELYGIVVKAQVPENMVPMLTSQMVQMSGPAGSQIPALMDEAKAKGRASKNIGGANVTINYRSNGQLVDFTYQVMGT